jgi:hypothetical protein
VSISIAAISSLMLVPDVIPDLVLIDLLISTR